MVLYNSRFDSGEMETIARSNEMWLLFGKSVFTRMGFVHLQTEFFMGKDCILKNYSYYK